MTVVADAGPLIALAKIGGLGTLFNLYPQIVTPQAVYDEAVREGHRVLAPDAALLQAEYDAGHLLVEAIQNPLTTATRQLGRGERESIQLALQRRADWLLVDDFEARKSAIKAFASSAAQLARTDSLTFLATTSSQLLEVLPALLLERNDPP